MYYFVHPTEALEGNVKVPGSKSQTARGLILARWPRARPAFRIRC